MDASAPRDQPPGARLRPNVHVYQTVCTHESRILRITQTLSELGLFSRIIIAGTWAAGLPECETLDPCRTILRVRHRWVPDKPGRLWKLLRLLEWQFRLVGLIARLSPSCLNCHNVWLLPLCCAIQAICRCKLVYDTHELETETAQSKGLRRGISKIMERLLIRRADFTVTVNASIGDWYRRTYGLDNVHVARNVYAGPSPQVLDRTRLRCRAGIRAESMIFLYQGLISPGRGIELLLRAFSTVADTSKHLVFLGFGPLAELVQEHASRAANIHFVPGVSPAELPEYTAGADVGIALVEHTSQNNRYYLGNKVFQYLGVGVPVLVSNAPELAAIVDQYHCGWKTTDSFDDLRSVIAGMTRDDQRAKAAHAEECRREFTWEREQQLLVSPYRELLASRRPPPGANAGLRCYRAGQSAVAPQASR